jgi:hypothetical protein
MGRYTNDVLKVTGANSMPNPDQSTNAETRGVWGHDVRNLFLAHDNEFALTYNGNPNGNLESNYIGRKVWNNTTKVMWVCTTSGTAGTAVWESLSSLVAAQVGTLLNETAIAMAIALG